jgi:hypothetical protein
LGGTQRGRQISLQLDLEFAWFGVRTMASINSRIGIREF